MELSLRPYVTAGVVVAGAGLIAAAPLGPSALEIQTRAVQLVSTEDLAADVVSAAAAQQEFPVSTWADVFLNAFSNLESLQSPFGLNGEPILQAVMENQLIYSNELATAAETAGTNLVTALQNLPDVLSRAMSDLTSGDVFDAETSITQFLTQTPLEVIRPLNNGFFEVAQSISNHLSNLLAGPDITRADAAGDLLPLSVPQWVTELVQAQLLAPHAAELAFAGVSQDIVTAIQGGDSTLAFSDLMNAPSTILDAFLNGYNLGDGGGSPYLVDAVPEALRNVSAQGLLSNEGTVATIREAMHTIARDISPLRAFEAPAADAAGATAAGADLHALVGDLSTLLSPDSALGEFVTAFDPNAIADITSLLTADLAPNASGWVADLFTLF
ncbi:MAG: hypothetical protein QOC88_3562 [Mycobacterium sp.]|nr:hypothetical protein [Mycobacterium sp.]